MKFGWCIDGMHRHCQREATTQVGVTLTCSCDCHETED